MTEYETSLSLTSGVLARLLPAQEAIVTLKTTLARNKLTTLTLKCLPQKRLSLLCAFTRFTNICSIAELLDLLMKVKSNITVYQSTYRTNIEIIEDYEGEIFFYLDIFHSFYLSLHQLRLFDFIDKYCLI
ncbi:hypothetical protein CFPU101_01460 [Chroococcus sp. FPU101]|nr:hypothetical protein CFPU101_01460 [Chroococcus sp. FPU101]